MSDLAMKVLEWQSKGEIGISSATMASIALGMDKNFYHSYFSEPSDPSDLLRCMKLVDFIPEIKDSFSEISERCPEFRPIIESWELLTSTLKREMAQGRKAPETYDLMKKLRSSQ